MFVFEERAVSLVDLRQVLIKNRGTGMERGILKYTDGVEVSVSADMARALLKHFK